MLKSGLEFDDENIYQIPGAYQVKQEDFRFNILYTDPSPLNYITEERCSWKCSAISFYPNR
jgi:hypothetical protein